MDNIIVNINSDFVDLNKYTSSNFVYHLDEEIKNLIYIKLGSIEFPSSFYMFMSSKNNVSFKIGDGVNEDTITLLDGNYTSDLIILKIQDALDLINTSRSKDYAIDIEIVTGKIFITCSDNFNLDFSNGGNSKSLGYLLGYSDDTYNGTSISAENVIRLNPIQYYFLKINELDNVKDYNVKNAFAKIIQTTGSFDFTIQGKSDFVSKEMVFRSPINLSRLNIQFVDYEDNILDFNGLPVSFTLEIGYVYDKKLYQEFNNNGIPNGDHRLKIFF